MDISFHLDRDVFQSKYQEVKPVLFKNALPLVNFSWRDANTIFDRADVASDDFKISFDGIRAKHEYVENYLDIGMLRHRLIKPAVYDFMRKGATLIANKIVNEPKIDSLVRKIAEFTGRQTVTSAYAAFGDRDSFRCHWDTRDVFAVQLIGRKRWIIYEPSLKSPLYMQQSKDFEHNYPCPEKPYMDFILEAGDVFYLPRGWWHNPLPLGEETFHLAVGTFPAYTMDYMQWIFQNLPEFVEARDSLYTWEKDFENLSRLSLKIGGLIRDPDNYRRFMDDFVGKTRVTSSLAIDVFGKPESWQLPAETALQLNTYHLHGLGDGYVIANGTKLNLDDDGIRLIQCIAESPGIRLCHVLDKLNELDSKKLCQLICKLCQEDILDPKIN
jgi:ribosomal protein L16 Arg81 hydroxylase